MEKKGVKRVKVGRQRPEFTFEDAIVLYKWSHENVYSFFGDMVLARLYKTHLIDDALPYLTAIVHPSEFKKAQSVVDKLYLRLKKEGKVEYASLLKKLKLYIKWLQSEVSNNSEGSDT